MSRLLIHTLLAMLLLHMPALSAQPSAELPAVDGHGLLDLSDWDPQAQPHFTLSGQWKFFPAQLISPEQLVDLGHEAIPLTVPGSWNHAMGGEAWRSLGHGVGTYSLGITGAAVNSVASLKLNHMCSNARIFFFPAGSPTSAPLQTIGTTSANAQLSIPSAASTVMPLQFTNSGLHQLVIQVSNFDSQVGGLCGDVMLGTTDAISQQMTLSTAFVSMMIAMIAMAALYSIAIYVKYRQDSASLWIAIACYSVACYFFSASGLMEIIVKSEDRWVYELRYTICVIANSFAAASILMFYCKSFDGYIKEKYLKINLLLTALGSLFFILAPASLMTGILVGFVIYWCLQFSLGLWVLFRAARDYRPYARSMILAALPIIILTPIDIHYSHTLIDAPTFLVYALVFFLFVQTQIIGSRFAKTYQLAERLSLNLKEEVALQTAELNEQNNKLAYAQKALQSANGALKKLSITDGLTKVHNRMYFEEEFRKEWRRCARQNLPISVLMVDADHFKLINDSAGHMAGDQCLQAISRKLQQHFKRAGELVARYGGEEFVAMLPNTDQRKALAVAEGLRSAIEKMEIEHNGNTHRVTISIGISTTTPSSNSSPDNLLEAADAALYEAKGKGRNRVALIPMLATGNKHRNQR